MFIKLISHKELPLKGCSKFVYLQELKKEIAITNTDCGLRLFFNTCPHAYAPFCDGPINRNQLTCPWHLFVFDLENGLCLSNNSFHIDFLKYEFREGHLYVKINQL